jgi:hypothetical protein
MVDAIIDDSICSSTNRASAAIGLSSARASARSSSRTTSSTTGTIGTS